MASSFSFTRTGLLALAAAFALGGCQSAQLSAEGVSASPRTSTVFEDVTLGYVEPRAPAELVMDYQSGRVLHELNPDGLRYPASLTKMMTLYLLFDAVDSGKLTLDTPLYVSANAARQAPSKLGLKAGTKVAVGDLAHGIATKSANDAAMVVAENLGGSADGFAKMMMAKARSIGMRRTSFVNPNGLPDPRQISTARDMAILARSLRAAHPRFTSFYAMTGYSFEGRPYRSTNKLLGKVQGVDGMKTGYIRDAGFNLVASAERHGKRIIVVVIGGETGRSRDAEVTRLVDAYLGPADPMPAMASLTQ
ncbi:D-alanyl-D-alanine carboxypeptidase family protein [Aureimonas psammosilenae]|uniref:D-alanyl-D-alanine carboxypeptidase family protein n=1 Tax=Aureimonas psammosilenae TaxID=2495496 RepID=UPI0012613730|nr:D-alanyl-D-alanine carboxypeptidase family protein [Aureimonas psammosilenae]